MHNNSTNPTDSTFPDNADVRSFDAIVVGGGPAGLSGAVALGRARRSALVIDAHEPRNAPAAHMHNYLTRDGMSPGDFLAAGREEVERYGGELINGNAIAAERREDGQFRIVLEDGRVFEARRLLVTTGLLDELPELPGLRERWGRDVLHCPYCHGWEVRDQAIGILGSGPMSLHQAQLWRQWSPTVTLFAGSASYEPGARAELAARDITVVEVEVSAVEVENDALIGVRMADGRLVPLQALVVAPRFTGRSALLTSLGLQAAEQHFGDHVTGTYIAADPVGATSVPGVWVAGNVTNLMAQVVAAAASGLMAGSAINADLITEEVRQATERLVPA